MSECSAVATIVMVEKLPLNASFHVLRVVSIYTSSLTIIIAFCFLAPKPEMIISPENVTVLPNHSFTMNCLALSFGLLKYDWSKHDGVLPQTAAQSCVHNILFDPLIDQTTNVYNLAVYNVQPSDEGWYCCVATNEAGSTVDCAWLEVNSKLHYVPLTKLS